MEFLDGLTLKHRIAGQAPRTDVLSVGSKLPTRWMPPTAKGSSIATSSRPTFSSPSADTPRFSISVWPRCTPGADSQARWSPPTPRPEPSRAASHQPGNRARHRRLHVTRTGARQRTGCAYRSFFLWRGAVRDGDRSIAVPGRDLGDDLRGHPESRSRPPDTTQSGLAAELERIINRALEKDRDLRYQHASDMRAELKRLKRDTDSSRHISAVSAEGTSAPQQR